VTETCVLTFTARVIIHINHFHQFSYILHDEPGQFFTVPLSTWLGSLRAKRSSRFIFHSRICWTSRWRTSFDIVIYFNIPTKFYNKTLKMFHSIKPCTIILYRVRDQTHSKINIWNIFFGPLKKRTGPTQYTINRCYGRRFKLLYSTHSMQGWKKPRFFFKFFQVF